MYFAMYDSPVGGLLLESDGQALTGLWMNRELPDQAESCPVLDQAALWLEGYFRGRPGPVAFSLKPEGTAFQKQVWQLLLTIPWGETRTYGDLAGEMARLLGKKTISAQAVGQALGRNPISIFIPCHRVVGTKGRLTGYAGGLEKKAWLLRHEGENHAKTQ